MIFHTVNFPNNRLPDLALHIDNVPIEKVTCFDFLGLRVSDTLKWQDHTNKIANKISKSKGVTPRLKHLLQSSTLLAIYNSLVLPHLYFSILCWGFESQRLVELQKRAVRNIHRAKYNAHSEPLFIKKSGLLALKDIFDFKCCKFYYKFKHSFLPDYFTKFFTLNNQIHNYDTRRSSDLHRFPVNAPSITFLICLIANRSSCLLCTLNVPLLSLSRIERQACSIPYLTPPPPCHPSHHPDYGD